jgi:hypothetical protein
MSRSKILSRSLAAGLVFLAAAFHTRAWDYEGHRIVNQLALASLPTNFPSFVFTAAAKERVAFLAGEPDRWRNTPDATLKHCNGPDHYLDIEDLQPYKLDPTTLSVFRYDFTAQLSRARAAHPENFPPIDPSKDAEHTHWLSGFLPWAIAEYQGKLKSGFSYLHELEQAGTPEEVANAQQNIIYVMGVMGHFVGDGAQPLHTTKHHHGWVGDNPNHYSTNYTIHSWIDGGYIHQFDVTTDKLQSKLRPAKLLSFDAPGAAQTNVFPVVMSYLLEQHKQVEPLYQLDKAGKLSGRRELNEEGYNFLTGQMLKASQMLGDLWLTAWQQAPPDTFLRLQLAKRKVQRDAPKPKSAN